MPQEKTGWDAISNIKDEVFVCMTSLKKHDESMLLAIDGMAVEIHVQAPSSICKGIIDSHVQDWISCRSSYWQRLMQVVMPLQTNQPIETSDQSHSCLQPVELPVSKHNDKYKNFLQ